MNVRKTLKQSDTIVGLVRDSKKILNIPNYISWLIRRNRIIKNYLSSNEIKKLQLGSGPSSLDGWLGSDIVPASDDVIFLNCTKPFPFDNDTFDYVCSEHMIEHITWHEGLFMLQECRRILKPGGTIRISTPDMKVFLGLLNHDESSLNERYIKWVTDRYLTGINIYKASFVINNVFRDWGHQFLYDIKLMETTMQESGFKNIKHYSVGESDNENLRGIESHGKNVNNDDMVAFETMVLEGTKE